jgi:D-3-phosphoglycerate dehydrogenase / 2-oxoglutarate reductase
VADVLTTEPSPGIHILIAEPQGFTAEAHAVLDAIGTVVVPDAPIEDLAGAFADFDVVWIRLGHRVDAAALGSAPRCRILAVPATGLDHVDLDACAALGIRVVSLKGEVEFLRSVRATAEHTVGLLLALLRHTVDAHRSVLDGSWDRDRFVGRDLFARTAGVVGVGRLGTIVAGYLGALGMHVIGFDPHAAVPATIECAPDLPDLLAAADVVTIHVSYDASTHHLIDAAALDAMRPGAVLINTSRGGVVDADALVAALERGHLAGAALDVVEGEPDVAGSPLLRYARQHDNLLLTPHLGGNTSDSGARTNRFIAERVRDALTERS